MLLETSRTRRTPATRRPVQRGDDAFVRHLELPSSGPSTRSPTSEPTAGSDVESEPATDETARVEEDVRNQDDLPADEDGPRVAPVAASQPLTETTSADIAGIDRESGGGRGRIGAGDRCRPEPSDGRRAVGDENRRQSELGGRVPDARSGSRSAERAHGAPASTGPATRHRHASARAPASRPLPPASRPPTRSSRATAPAAMARARRRKSKRGNRGRPRSAAVRSPGNPGPAPAADAPHAGAPRTEQPVLPLPPADRIAPPIDANADTSGTSDRVEQVAQAESNPRNVPLAQRLSDHLFGRGLVVAGNGMDSPPVDQARLIHRVAQAIQAAPRRGGILRLRLSPPELGSLQLEVTIHKGVLSAKLETESHMTCAVLLEHLPQLRDRLEEQGMRVAQFDVDVSHRDAQDSPFQPNQHDQSFAPEKTTRRLSPLQETPQENLESTTKPFASMPGKLNVVV